MRMRWSTIFYGSGCGILATRPEPCWRLGASYTLTVLMHTDTCTASSAPQRIRPRTTGIRRCHSRKKDKDTREMLPIQFAVRKTITLRDGTIAWRLGETQKKDGFFGGLRKSVARRGHPTSGRNAIREMCYFYQWVYWRTRDPEKDAIRGCHDRSEAPLFDLLTQFGRLRRKLREHVGDDILKEPEWLTGMEDADILDGLPLHILALPE